MIIQGTKRLLDEFGLSRRRLSHIGKKEYPRGLFDWYANVVDFGGVTGIVLMNNLTRYPVILLVNEQFQIELIPEYIVESLRREGIHETVLECYRKYMGMLLIDKTSDQELTQKLRYVCDEVLQCRHLLDESICLQAKLGREAARKRMYYVDAGYKAASDRMFEMLEALKTDEGADVPLFDLEMLDLLVKLEIPDAKIEVRLLVPSNITFSLFHKLIIKLFDWNVRGEYAFFCGGAGVGQYSELKEIDWSAGVRYDYWMPGCYRWEHTVCVVSVMPHQHRNDAVAVECRGYRPPWELEGPQAYAEYQRSLMNCRHPGHEAANNLHNRCGARRRSLREMNVELKWVMTR